MLQPRRSIWQRMSPNRYSPTVDSGVTWFRPLHRIGESARQRKLGMGLPRSPSGDRQRVMRHDLRANLSADVSGASSGCNAGSRPAPRTQDARQKASEKHTPSGQDQHVILERERVRLSRYPELDAARADVFECIERFHTQGCDAGSPGATRSSKSFRNRP